MTTRVLFVCLGNYCRSPAAEAIFRQKAKAAKLDVTIDSAGTSGWHVGVAPYEPMQAAASRYGYDLSALRGRALHDADFELFDLIIGMDQQNIDDILARRPAGNETTVRPFMAFSLAGEGDHIPDPYYSRDFDGAIRLIEIAADGLLDQLEQ